MSRYIRSRLTAQCTSLVRCLKEIDDKIPRFEADFNSQDEVILKQTLSELKADLVSLENTRVSFEKQEDKWTELIQKLAGEEKVNEDKVRGDYYDAGLTQNLEQLDLTINMLKKMESIEETKLNFSENIYRSRQGSLNRMNMKSVEQEDRKLEQDTAQEHIDQINFNIGSAENVDQPPQLSISMVESQDNGITPYRSNVTLPPIKLQMFDGNKKSWTSFIEMFDITVGCQTIPDIQKMSYLMNLLKGSAKEAVAGFQITSANYPLVRKTLQESFGDVTNTYRELYDSLRKLSCYSDSTQAAEEFTNKVRTLHLQLQRQNRQFDEIPFLLAVEEKIPRWMNPIILNQKMRISPWTVEELLKTMRLAINHRSPLQKTSISDGFSTMSVSNRKGIKPHEDKRKLKRFPCIFCSAEKHGSANCDKLRTIEARKKFIIDNRRCIKCIGNGHMQTECTKNGAGCRCGSGRHFYICCAVRKQSSFERAKETTTAHFNELHKETVALMTKKVVVRNPITKKKTKALAFFDSGCEKSFISHRLARYLNIAKSQSKEMNAQTISGAEQKMKYFNTTIELETQHGPHKIDVRSVKKIMAEIPVVRISNDRNIVTSRNIPDILIGEDKFWEIIVGKKKRKNNLFVIKSLVGDIVTGKVANMDTSSLESAFVLTSADLDEKMEQMCSLDSIGITDNPEQNDDEEAMRLFREKVTFDEKEKRYVVPLPFKEPNPHINSNETIAYRQIIALKERVKKNTEIRDKMDEIIKYYLDNGIVEVVPEAEKHQSGRVHYLPFHPVVTPSKKSTKVRIVHNGSAHLKNELSLNQHLYRGPVMLLNLIKILFQFREHSQVVVGDVEKAFNQLKISKTDADLLRFFYPKDWQKPFDDENLETLRFRRLNFGVTSSPFLLAATLKLHLEKGGTPLDKEILNSTYVDNVLMEARTKEEGLTKIKMAKQRFEQASMNLRDFISSNSQINKELGIVPSQETFMGYKWNIPEDTIQIDIPRFDLTDLTKRKLLQQCASVYDPLGLVVPALLLIRLIIQSLWKENKKWDELIPETSINTLRKLVNDLPRSIRVPRRVTEDKREPMELHVFVDASQQAYAACAYIKRIGSQEPATLIFSKAKLAPLKKKLTIPRLELMAALIGSRMIKFIRETSSMNIKKCILWSDSQIVLHWIMRQKEKAIFITNRVVEIVKTECEFRYIATENNPADIGSRGISATDLMNNELWFHGPDFLKDPEDKHPIQPIEEIQYSEDNNSAAFAIVFEPQAHILDYQRFSQWNRLVGTVKRILEFSFKARGIIKDQTEIARTSDRILIERIQNEAPPTEKLNNDLRIYRDEQGLLRSKGRLENSGLSPSAKDPIYIPREHPATVLLVMKFHNSLMHGSANYILAQIRKQYWIPRAKTFVRRVIKENCLECRKEKAKPFKLPLFPDLPSSRVNMTIPFEHCGVDLAGPFNVKENDEIQKIWIVLITCFATRAIHTETVDGLSAAQFIHAMRRFVARRGVPTSMLSDNGTNLTGAAPILKEAWSAEDMANIGVFIENFQIQWKFIPALAPWTGGTYERMIGVLKSSLKRSIKNRLLSKEEFITVVTECENIVNMRPLTALLDDTKILRPIDFLAPGRRAGILRLDNKDDDEDYTESTKNNLGNTWKSTRNILDNLWKCWTEDYLLTLRERYKHEHKRERGAIQRNPRVGEIVIIANGILPRGRWKTGQIAKLHYSKDGYARSADVKMSNGHLLTRSILHLYPLEINNDTDYIESESIQHEIRQEPEGHRYNLRPRRTAQTNVFFVLSILSCLINATYGCSGSLLYREPCRNMSWIVEEDSNGALCISQHNCMEPIITPLKSRLCGLHCSCPSWAKGCVNPHLTIPHNDQKIMREFGFSRTPNKKYFMMESTLIHTFELKNFSRIETTGIPMQIKQKYSAETECFGHGPITGTKEYCTVHKGCIENGTQFCILPYEDAAFVKIEGIQLEVTAWSSQMEIVYMRPRQNQFQFQKKCSKVKMRCHTQGVQLESYCGSGLRGRICVSNNHVINCTSIGKIENGTIMRPPSSFLIFNHFFNASIQIDEEILQQIRIECPRQAYCNFTRKLFSTRRLTEGCMFSKPNIWEAIIMITITIMVSILLVIITTYYINRRSLNHTQKEEINADSFELVETDSQELDSNEHLRIPVYSPRHIPKLSISIAIICMMITNAQGCTETNGFRAESSKCLQMKNGTLQCAYEENTILALKEEKESCLILSSPSKVHIGTIKIKAQPQLRCEQVQEWFFPNFRMETTSVKRCPGSGSCSGKNCQNIHKMDIIQELSSVNSFPGVTRCSSACGCWGCGCLLCSDGCIFYRNYITKKKPQEIFHVFQCSWKEEVEYEIEEINGQFNHTSHFSLESGGSVKLRSNLTISLDSSSGKRMENRLYVQNQRTGIVSMITPEKLSTISMVKCPSSRQAEKMDCMVDDSSCQCQIIDEDMMCSCSDRLLESYLNTGQLPQLVDEDLVIWDQKEIKVKLDEIALTQINMHDYNIETVTEDSTCEEFQARLAGCFNCLAGAVLHYNCTTDFGNQLVMADCGSHQFMIECGGPNIERWVLTHFTEEYVELKCILSCPNNVLSFRVHGYLEEIENDEEKWQTHNGHHAENHGFIEDIVQWIKNLTLNFFHGILVIIIVITSIVAIYYSVRCFCCLAPLLAIAVASVLYFHSNTEFLAH